MDEIAARPTPTLREMTREAVRTRISDVAIDLASEHGFDHATVERIAAEVGISARSFNRYFPTKEDAVLGDAFPWGELLRDTFAARPTTEPIWESLHAACLALLGLVESQGERRKRIIRIVTGTPSLRARNLEKQLLWAEILTPLVKQRVGGTDALLRAQTLVQASLGCFSTALTGWAESAESRSPAKLLTITFDTLKPTK